MKNDNLSKIIRGAYESPVGSTKRAHAKKILSVMTKLNGGAFDGQGGPSIPYQEPALPTYSRLMVFPGAPKMMTPEERIRRDQMLQMNDGQGGPFSMTIPGQPIPPTTSAVSTPQTIPAPAPTPTPTGYTIGDYGNAFASGASTILGAPFRGIGHFASRNVPGTEGYDIYHPEQPGVTPPSPVPATGPVAGPVQPQAGSTTPPASTTPSPATPTKTSTGSSTGGGLPKAGTTGGASSPAGKYSWLQQSISGNLGGTAFALGAMNDKDRLRQLPGFENVKDEDLPYGASLAKQIDALGDTLKKEHHLDEILNEKNNMIATGVNLKGDLTDYITGRDEFLNQTNDMIEKAKSGMLTSPNAADPVVQAQNKSYLNYLYLLKGRQSKSYVDFLDSSVNKYQADLTDITNHYNTALSSYENELKSKTAITTEQYSMYYNALTDMYKTAEEAPQKKLEMEKTKLEMDHIRSQMANDAIRAKADLLKAMGKNDKPTFMNSWGDLQKIKAIDEKGNLNTNYTLADTETLSHLGIPATDYMQAILYAGRNAMTNPDPKDGTMPGMSTILKTGESLMANMKMLEAHGASSKDPLTQYMAQSNAGQVKEDTRSALKGNSAVLPSDQQGKLIDAASYLAKGGGWNPFSSNKAVSRETFLGKFKDSGIDEKFLDALFTNYQGYGNGKDFSNNILNEMDNVNGKVVRVKTPEEVRNKVIDMMVEKNFTF